MHVALSYDCMTRFAHSKHLDLPHIARIRGIRVDPATLCEDCRRQFSSPQRQLTRTRVRLPRPLIRAALITFTVLVFLVLTTARFP